MLLYIFITCYKTLLLDILFDIIFNKSSSKNKEEGQGDTRKTCDSRQCVQGVAMSNESVSGLASTAVRCGDARRRTFLTWRSAYRARRLAVADGPHCGWKWWKKTWPTLWHRLGDVADASLFWPLQYPRLRNGLAHAAALFSSNFICTCVAMGVCDHVCRFLHGPLWTPLVPILSK